MQTLSTTFVLEAEPQAIDGLSISISPDSVALHESDKMQPVIVRMRLVEGSKIIPYGSGGEDGFLASTLEVDESLMKWSFKYGEGAVQFGCEFVYIIRILPRKTFKVTLPFWIQYKGVKYNRDLNISVEPSTISYSLMTSHDVISFQRDAENKPIGYTDLRVSIKKKSGLEEKELAILPADSDLSVSWCYDNGTVTDFAKDNLVKRITAADAEGHKSISVMLYQNSVLRDKKTILFVYDGPAGQPGSQGIEGCVYRTSEWEPNKNYLNQKNENITGLRYIDRVIVINDNTGAAKSYLCTQSHKSSAANKPPSDFWKLLPETEPFRTPLIIADNAVFKMTQTNKILVMDPREGEEGLACMQLSGGEFPIMLGLVSDSGLYCNFKVDRDGHMFAVDGSFSGIVKADRGYFRGFITKGLTIINQNNIGEFTRKRRLQDGGDCLNYDNLSGVVYFEGHFPTGMNIPVCYLPSYDRSWAGTPTVDEEVAKEARQFIGVDMIFYNYSDASIPVSGFTTDTDEGNYHSVAINPRMGCRFTCKFKKDSSGKDCVYWLENRFSF